MGHDHSHATTNRRRLAVVFAVTLAVAGLQAGVSLFSGSLALLADAGHMVGDAFGVALALVAITVARRPSRAGSASTFGHLRTEILAAGANATLLLVVSIVIAVSAVRRLADPPPIDAGWVMVAAAIGLTVNVVSLSILRGGAEHSLNVRGAYLEVLGDALGSMAVLASAVIIWATGWLYADPIASLLIAAMIVPRALSLLKDVLSVLMERTPPGLDLAGVREHLLGVDQVVDVHDLHIWQITSDLPVMTAHVTVDDSVADMDDAHEILDRMHACLRDHFDVQHSTFQIEPVGHQKVETHTHS